MQNWSKKHLKHMAIVWQLPYWLVINDYKFSMKVNKYMHKHYDLP